MDPLVSLKSAYVGSMRSVRQGLNRLGADGGRVLPDRRWRHWAYSLTIVHDSRAMAALDVPWWTYRAMEAVDEWLSARSQPARVFEYGSGASTVWLARRSGEVHSVEHNRGFAGLMQPELVPHPNASVRVVEAVPSARPVVSSRKEGHAGLDFAEYVAAIDAVPGSFDLVVIDGRAREACLAAAISRLAGDGVIVFDNSRRRRYRAAIAESGLQERPLRGLTPTLPYPEQTSLLTPR